MIDPSPGTTRLADVTLGELRRALVTVAVLLTVLYVFLGMISSVFLAGILGAVAGVYLIPLSDRLTRTRPRSLRGNPSASRPRRLSGRLGRRPPSGGRSRNSFVI